MTKWLCAILHYHQLPPRLSFPSMLQEGRLNLELFQVGDPWFHFPRASFHTFSYFLELIHWTPGPLRSLGKVENHWHLFVSIGSDSTVKFPPDFHFLVLYFWTFQMWVFLRHGFQIGHLELVSPDSLPSIWKVYQFSWRGSTMPSTLDVDVTFCKPFHLWENQSQKIDQIHFLPGSKFRLSLFVKCS